jgi:hypothetical protein
MSVLPPAPIDPATGQVLCPWAPSSQSLGMAPQPSAQPVPYPSGAGLSAASPGLTHQGAAAIGMIAAAQALPPSLGTTGQMLAAAQSAAAQYGVGGIVAAINSVASILAKIDAHISLQIAQAGQTCANCLTNCSGCVTYQIGQASNKVGQCCNKITNQINAILSQAQACCLQTAGGQSYLAAQQVAELQAAGVPAQLAVASANTVSTVPSPPLQQITASGGISAGNIGQLSSALAIALYPLATAIAQLAQAASGQPIGAAPAGPQPAPFMPPIGGAAGMLAPGGAPQQSPLPSPGGSSPLPLSLGNLPPPIGSTTLPGGGNTLPTPIPYTQPQQQQSTTQQQQTQQPQPVPAYCSEEIFLVRSPYQFDSGPALYYEYEVLVRDQSCGAEVAVDEVGDLE